MKNLNELADVRQMYVTHHNTVIDHRSRLHVQTSLDSKPPTPAAALQHLLTTSPNINGLGVWMSARTVFVCRGWDRLLEQALARAAPSTLVTAVPLPASHAPIRALALLGRPGGYQKEDDLELSPFYWKWLKACHGAYGHRKDFAACSLQRAALCAADCPNLEGGPASATTNFMSPLVGSWGFSPTPAHWVRYTRWAKEFEASGQKPYVEGHTPTAWYREFEKQGRCPGKNCMVRLSVCLFLGGRA